MKISALNTALVLSLGTAALLPINAQAADGLINFVGQITAQTCTISGNGGGKDFTVTLPTVSVQTLPAVGSWAGRTPFNIALSGCSPATGNVATYFEPGVSTDLTTGYLKNDTGTGQATNVQLQLLNDDTTGLQLNQAKNGTNGSKTVALNAGAATLNYFVQYTAVGGAATAGKVASRTNYTIVYN
ncbi:fimbrial protein [Aquirhabdus sp.]|uniref:fimbrial protein n=1 Tax=Aquirhabdus sp. TaxID=2824160 RepID=UPI00396D0401